MKKEYYYIDEHGEQFGPYSLEIFRLLPLRGETLVWHTGMGEWAAADTMEELKGFLRKESPSPDTGDRQVESGAPIPPAAQENQPSRPMPKRTCTERETTREPIGNRQRLRNGFTLLWLSVWWWMHSTYSTLGIIFPTPCYETPTRDTTSTPTDPRYA